MQHLPRLSSLIFNQLHHITPEAAEIILNAIGDRIGLLDMGRAEPEANAWTGRRVLDRDGRSRGYRVTEKGVGIVSVQGELVNRGAWLGSYSGLVSYEGLRQSLRNAALDREVKAIVMDIDSPGGMAQGMLETAALVRQINGEKPIYAISNGMMASAAYGISSGARAIIASDLGPVGSIGTLFMHVDRSKQLDKAGLNVTLIHAGAHKVDGHPFAPLPDAVRADIVARIEATQSMFVNAVVEGRGGRVDEKRVRATEARTYNGKDAVAAGIADDVGTFDAVVGEVEANINRPASRVPARAQPQENSMNLNMGGPAAEQPGSGFEGMTIGEFNQAVDAMRQSLAAAPTVGQPTPAPAPAQTAPVQSVPVPVQTQTQPSGETPEAACARGRSEERARIQAILTHEAAQGRQASAQVLALGSDVSVAQAGAMLEKMPKEQAAGGRTSQIYAAVAASGGNPRVSHQGDGAENTGYKSNLKGSMERLTAKMPKPKAAPVG